MARAFGLSSIDLRIPGSVSPPRTGDSACSKFRQISARSAPRSSQAISGKPPALIQWLVDLVTPPGGVVLDPFAGSGTTGLAALAEGCHPILIEKEPEYVRIIRHRLADPVQLTFAVR